MSERGLKVLVLVAVLMGIGGCWALKAVAEGPWVAPQASEGNETPCETVRGELD